MIQKQTTPKLVEVLPGGKLRLNFHPGQSRAWRSEKRFVCVLAGTQSGKTEYGPHWLRREIEKRGPGDYLVVTPTYPLLNLKALPVFLRLFDNLLKLGKPHLTEKRFTVSSAGEMLLWKARQDQPTNVFFGYAAAPDSLESATAKAVWLDEAGQKRFKLGSWEAIQRRLSVNQGRALITTTPYDLGWLKVKIWDQWQAAKGKHPDIDVIRFDSTQNPAFPKAEFERARANLPAWKFDLFYRAIFTRPAGLIYDSFDTTRHVVPRFPIPAEWPRYLGLDFGGVNTAGMFYAAELDGSRQETGRLFAYRQYKAGGRTAKEHATALLEGEPRIPYCVGGSKSEGQWRDEFSAGGLPVGAPQISDVEVGIDRVYGAHKRGEIMVFSDLDGYLSEKGSYSRELNDAGEPTEAIDDKNSYHFLDSERYIIGYLKGAEGAWEFGAAPPEEGSLLHNIPDGVFLN